VPELLVVIVTGLLVIAGATLVGPRLGIAAPLVLVAIGVAASFLPVFEAAHIEPEWILEGVLPPLLYSSAVSMPAMNFRREFGAISGIRAPRDLSAPNRLSDSQNWRTVELVLEGAVFLTMGLQIKAIVANVQNDHAGIGSALLVSAGALVLPG
jgi:NhaP-type Na+/H+ or K+/H+ antiporter